MSAFVSVDKSKSTQYTSNLNFVSEFLQFGGSFRLFNSETRF